MTEIQKWKDLGSRLSQPFLAIVESRKRKKSTENPPSSEANGKDTSRLLNMLPVELLLIIVNQLDVVEKVCLQSTNTFFRQLIQVDRAVLDGDRCRKWAITCLFEVDMKKYPAKVACAFCKTVRKQKFFNGIQEREILKMGNISIRLLDRLRSKPGEMMTHDPMERYCIAHRKDMFRDRNALVGKSSLDFEPAPMSRPRWAVFRVLRCWHCARCIAEDDLRKAGCLHCLCDFCPRFASNQYFRSGPCVPGGGQYRYDFTRDTGVVAKRFVAETGSE